jgi:transcriptional regulator with XRE-family HTH domain
MDRAAIAFIMREQQARGLSRPKLAELAGIPYQTVRGWWDNADSTALSIADIQRFLKALGIDGAQAYKEIERLAITMQDPTE